VPRFEKTLQVSAPADRAWAVIGDPTVMGELAGATRGQGRGDDAGVYVPGWAVQHEQISDYSPDQRSYRYAIEDGPLPVKNNQGSFAVRAAGADSVIVWEAEFEPLDPSQEQEMSEMWEGAMEQVLAGVKVRIEAAP
jgi:hypothetical protein